MIIDQLNNAVFYRGLSRRIAAGLKFLAQTDCRSLAPGRHAIDGDNVFALAQEYQTKPRSQGVWEAHRRYIDIQYVVSGIEIMGYAPISALAVTQPYSAEKDCALFAGGAAGIGEFFRAPAAVRKVVVKVELASV